MKKLNLEPGMIACTRNPMALGRAINFVQKIKSIDNQSEYSHALIIMNEAGGTFESLWSVRHSHLSEYVGKKILIGKLVDVSLLQRLAAMEYVVGKFQGLPYPLWRLAFYLIPLAAKFISSGKFPVCSELVFAYVSKAGINHVGRWSGKNPDHAADFIKHDDAVDVVFEGILTNGHLFTGTNGN